MEEQDLKNFSIVKIIHALNELQTFTNKDILKLYKLIKRSEPTILNKVINKLSKQKEAKLKELSKALLDKVLSNVRTIFFYLNYLPQTEARIVFGEIIQSKYLELVSFRNKYLISLTINVKESTSYLDKIRVIIKDIDNTLFDELKKELI